MKKLLICLVNYNTEHDIYKFVESVEKKSVDLYIEYSLADNSNTFDSNITYTDRPFYVYKGYGNVGYLPGALIGFSNGSLKFDDYDFIWITNTDIEISEDFFRLFYEFVESKGSVVYAPQVIDSLGCKQNPLWTKRPTNKKISIISIQSSNIYLYYIYTLLSRIRKRLSFNSSRTGTEGNSNSRVYALHGCSMIIPSNLFKRTKHSYEPFLFCEELYLAEEARIQGIDCYVDERNVVRHHEHASFMGLPKRNQVQWLNESICWIKQRYWK